MLSWALGSDRSADLQSSDLSMQYVLHRHASVQKLACGILIISTIIFLVFLLLRVLLVGAGNTYIQKVLICNQSASPLVFPKSKYKVISSLNHLITYTDK